MRHRDLTEQAALNRSRQPVKHLVENRSVYESHEAELSIYDTFEAAKNVYLEADEVLYCGMISGRKTLHQGQQFKTDFLPHESFVMAPGESINIDFPDASQQYPTSCLTLGISRKKLVQVCDTLNQQSPRPQPYGEWEPVIGPGPDVAGVAGLGASHGSQPKALHTFHNEATQQLLTRIVDSFLNRDKDRDLVLNLGVTELLTRLLRQEGQQFLQECARRNPESSELNATVHYLETHLSQAIGIDQLCKIACMSRSKLYHRFKSIVGCGPMEYLQQRRLDKARKLIQSGWSVTRACFEVGYSNASHFTRRFQQKYGISPREFASRYRKD